MKTTKIVLATIDYLVLVAATLVAYSFSPSFYDLVFVAGQINPSIRGDIFVMPLFLVVGLYLSGVHTGGVTRSYIHLEVRIIFGLAGGMAAYLLWDVFSSYSLMGRFITGISVFIGNIGIMSTRIIYNRIASQFRRRVVFYGSPQTYDNIKEAIESDGLPIDLVENLVEGFALRKPHDAGRVDYFAVNKINDVIVDVSGSIPPDDRREIMESASKGMNVIDVNVFFEGNFSRVYGSNVDERWFWGFNPSYSHHHYLLFKRGTDVAISLLGLVVSLPLWAVIAVAIRLQDRGPIFYKQSRVGIYGKAFIIFKFRTMSVDAEKSGAEWAKKQDPRVTMIGKILRRTRLDELPQFWNILLGDMSFIGPRPERPEFVCRLEEVIPFYRYRHLVKPGLTGWAQINYPYGASVDDARNKLAYDLYYIKYASIGLDLVIAARTAVAMAKGAR